MFHRLHTRRRSNRKPRLLRTHPRATDVRDHVPPLLVLGCLLYLLVNRCRERVRSVGNDVLRQGIIYNKSYADPDKFVLYSRKGKHETCLDVAFYRMRTSAVQFQGRRRLMDNIPSSVPSSLQYLATNLYTSMLDFIHFHRLVESAL